MSIDYAKYVSELVARAKAAQAIADGYTQERVDELCAAIAYRTTRPEWAPVSYTHLGHGRSRPLRIVLRCPVHQRMSR